MYGLSKAAANTGAFAAAQIAGFNDQVVKFSGTTTLIATFQPGYEGVSIESIEIRDEHRSISKIHHQLLLKVLV
jgi:hypothetical protein